jgi:hypothetical protein
MRFARRKRWVGYVARIGEMRNSNKILVGKPEEMEPLARPRRRWEDIRMYLTGNAVGSCGLYACGSV